MEEDYFCGKCGERLIIKEITAKISFNEKTGKKRIIIKQFCPKKRFWNNHYSYQNK